MAVFYALLAFTVLGGITFGFYQLVVSFFGYLSVLQKEVAAAIIAAMATVIVSIASVTLGKYFERKISIEQDQRKRKIEIYESLIKFLFRIVNSSRTGEEVSEEEMIQFFIQWTQTVIVWGSNDVIKQWTCYRLKLIAASEDNQQLQDTFVELEKLLLAIRKDLGYSASSFKKGELLSLFINDVNKYIA